MDNIHVHLAPFPRQFPHPRPVLHIGYVPHKRDWVGHAFNSFNFSLILSGNGSYRTAERTWPVRAPCVITQWPGLHVEYGPEPEWEELYLIYSAASLPQLRDVSYAQDHKPVWYINDPVPMRRRLAELRELIGSPGVAGSADRIDRVCDELVMESLLGEASRPTSQKEGAIDLLRHYLEENCMEEVDFDLLAAEAGFSPASFRRHWGRYVGMPPAQFMSAARIQQACRLLVETELSIKEIARRLRFEDALYFSRRFRQLTGASATEYRRLHQDPLSLL